jgi:hypothetical protein
LHKKELIQSARLVLGDVDSRDIHQGIFDNSSFIAALSVLTATKKNWEAVVPDADEQEIRINAYVGIFKFRFWRKGRWVEVVIDDLLPTVDGKLVCTHAESRNEFWAPLLEKAYAK